MATAPEPANDEAGMDDTELASLLAAHESRAVGFYNSEIADEQAKALNYYYGKMDDLPQLEGCSGAIDHTVAVMVDNALAAILKPFVSADEVVSFEPRGEEDVAVAEQATEYVNYVLNCDNPGFLILHNWFKDALLTKIGVVKAWWEDQSRSNVQQSSVDAMGLMQARQHEGYLGEQDHGDGTFTVDIQQNEEDGRVKIEPVPPEEFLITPYARSIEEAAYVAHRPSNYTRSDLVELGFDADIVDDLPAYSQGQDEESRKQARYRDEDWSNVQQIAGRDKSLDLIGVIDEYVKCDYDGDGRAELRRVIRVSDVILFNEEIEEAPFALLCPCPMPHKVYGRSVADQSVEGQKVSTAILRQTLDNLYKSNNPRPIVGDRAHSANGSTMEDLGDSSPGAAIRAGDTTQLDWLVVPFNAQHSFPMLEYQALQTEERTGIQRKGNGLNPETLKKNSPDTATQASIDENSRNERAEMIARIFAETGVKRLFTLVLKLLIRHQPKARVIRLRNQWVPMDPRGWPEMDVGISVGLGVGNKAEMIAQADSVLQTMAELQQTPYAWLIDAGNVHSALKRKFTATGIKNVDEFLKDPAQTKPPEPQPDPEMAKAQAKMQIDAAKAQADQQTQAAKLQIEMVQGQSKMQLEMQQASAKLQLEREKTAAQAQLAQAKAEFEAQLAAAKMRFEQQLAEKELAIDAQLQSQRAENDHKAAMKKNRPGGDLSK